MTTRTARSVVTLAPVALFVLLAGCGSTTTDSASTSPSAAPTPSAAGATQSPRAHQAPLPEEATIVEIAISGGTVTPTNGQTQATIGKPIVLQVTSDVADQLHVHSVPEHTFNVEPRPDQNFEFTVDVPGQVDVELHDVNRTVVTIQVRP